MPKISEQHRRERSELILAAAMRCFARAGVAATSVADIHRESGVSVGGIYRYFASKQEMLMAIATAEQRRLNETLTRVVAGAGAPEDLLGALVGALVEFRDSHPVDVNRLAVAGWLEAADNAELSGLLGASFAVLAEALGGRLAEWGVPAGERGELVQMLRILVMGTIAVGVIDPGAGSLPSTRGLRALVSFVGP